MTVTQVTVISEARAAPEAIHCGSLLDVRAGRLIEDQVVAWDKDGVIIYAGPASLSPDGITPIDLSGLTCLPGLIDVHTHITWDPQNSGYKGLGISVPREAVTGVKNARLLLLSGFTSIRNVGASHYTDVAVRDGVNAGEIPGPRMIVSGPPLTITGGHCDKNLLPSEFSVKAEGVADGPWVVRQKVREVIKFGADVIKICASGGVLSKGDSPGTEQYTLEEMQAIVSEAHRLERKVAAHAHGAESIKDAIRAGVDSVEHCSFIDDKGIRLAKEHGAYLVFDIYNDDYILSHGEKNGVLPESLEKERQLGRLQRENFRKAFQAGARMAFGTDSGVYPHGDNAKQFAKMVEWGMRPVDAIRAATINAADLLGQSGKLGILEKGYYADIIAVRGNPLEDITILEDVSFIMKGGKVYRNDIAK
ncbi:MAG TPA: amidohydrolase family protein [Nitrosospira sp.]|nr:amidohydrolase family protein [Nitrosospira sp.]